MWLNSSFIDRLTYLYNQSEVASWRKFAENIGITNGNINSYKKGAQPTLDRLINILTNIDNLNPGWLIKGDEPIFISNSLDSSIVSEPEEKYLSMREEVIRSQQRTIESQQVTIKNLIEKNNTAEGA